jgi:hypothetical protein
MSASDWVVYSRPDCGLCEQFQFDLAELLGPRADQVRIVDIDSDAELKRKYGERIPALIVDGDYVCGIRLDAERVRRYL